MRLANIQFRFLPDGDGLKVRKPDRANYAGRIRQESARVDKQQQAEIVVRIEQHQKREGDFPYHAVSLISLASRAAELFERSKTEQKRQLLVALRRSRPLGLTTGRSACRRYANIPAACLHRGSRTALMDDLKSQFIDRAIPLPQRRG
jgi:hypothetical protein